MTKAKYRKDAIIDTIMYIIVYIIVAYIICKYRHADEGLTQQIGNALISGIAFYIGRMTFSYKRALDNNRIED